jgi:hypothetical protein
VRWSSAHALADTLANLDGKRIAFAVTLGDVDTGEAYRFERGCTERLIPPALSAQNAAPAMRLI